MSALPQPAPPGISPKVDASSEQGAPAPMIVDYVAEIVARLAPPDDPLRHLDMGSGPGDLIRRLNQRLPRLQSCGVDYHPVPLPVPVSRVDLSRDRIPHDDASFDLVTCTEVIEHLENFRHALREASRVLRPGGLFVVSTPNVLSLKSRWAFLTRGFFTYFNPLSLQDDPHTYAAQRHITPIPFFYLGHALLDAGFEAVTPHQDKAQKSSAFWATLLGPIFRTTARRSRRRLARRYWELPQAVDALAFGNNSWVVLTGRTLIVTARRMRPSQP